MNDYAFLGIGWGFPPRFSAPGSGPDLVAGETLVEQSMRLILGTAQGARVMRPSLGALLEGSLFDSMDADALGLLEQSVYDALLQNEPRIALDEVRATPGDDPGHVVINIDYTVLATNTRSNLVYPFYLNEATL